MLQYSARYVGDDIFVNIVACMEQSGIREFKPWISLRFIQATSLGQTRAKLHNTSDYANKHSGFAVRFTAFICVVYTMQNGACFAGVHGNQTSGAMPFSYRAFGLKTVLLMNLTHTIFIIPSSTIIQTTINFHLFRQPKAD